MKNHLIRNAKKISQKAKCNESGTITLADEEPYLPWDRPEQLIQSVQSNDTSDVNLNQYSFYERLTETIAPQVLAEVRKKMGKGKFFEKIGFLPRIRENH